MAEKKLMIQEKKGTVDKERECRMQLEGCILYTLVQSAKWPIKIFRCHLESRKIAEWPQSVQKDAISQPELMAYPSDY